MGNANSPEQRQEITLAQLLAKEKKNPSEIMNQKNGDGINSLLSTEVKNKRRRILANAKPPARLAMDNESDECGDNNHDEKYNGEDSDNDNDDLPLMALAKKQKREGPSRQRCFDDEDYLPLAQILVQRRSIVRQNQSLSVSEGNHVKEHPSKEAKATKLEFLEEAKIDDDTLDRGEDDDIAHTLGQKKQNDKGNFSQELNDDDSTEHDKSNDRDQEVENDNSDTVNESSSNSSFNGNEVNRRKSPRKKSKTSRMELSDKAGRPRAGPRGPESERTCPHCNKVLSLKDALRYHIDHFVCRPDLNPNQEPKNRGGRKRRASGANNAKALTNERIPKEQRVCPNCQRVFTSAYGLSYHMEHSVCEQKAPLPFAALEPGSRFSTPFGVVEVVADNRAVPTASFAPDLKKLTRNWSGWKSKRDVQLYKVWSAAAVRQRIRRYQLASLYSNDNNSKGLTKEAVFEAYFGGNPTKIQQSMWSVPTILGPLRPDPMYPIESYPERIVECIQIADQRKKYLGPESEDWYRNGASGELNGTTSRTGRNRTIRLYLQRKLLTEPYNPDMNVWCCRDCGGYFTSKPGIKSHVDSQVCKKAKAKVQSAREKLEEIETRARRPPKKKEPVLQSLPHPPKRKKEDAMYPQVWLSLGIRLLPNKKVPLVFAPPTEEATIEPEIKVVEPDAILHSLRAQLQFVTMVQNVSLGPIYPEVFTALGFRKPRVSKRKRNSGEEQAEQITTLEAGGYRPRRRRQSGKLPPPPPPKPLPPIIDVRALADEVDIGRYPSIKRYKGDEHDDQCFICKEGGTLFCCDFCTKAVHMSCLLEKYTVKHPEPQDDFMCHRCIQCILARRARAEQRRIRKQQLKDKLATPGEIPADMKGFEYEYLASQGQEVSELMELLQDAQTRLRLALEAEKVNDLRRSFIESCECRSTTTAAPTTAVAVTPSKTKSIEAAASNQETYPLISESI